MKHKGFIAFVVLIIAFMGAGSIDYQAEIDEERIYRANVCDGIWPDFKGQEPSCEKNLSNKSKK
tara:strand:+ start:293 stop:484 length:192 start_codon:yes stop_codon:yes gene_type:complete